MTYDEKLALIIKALDTKFGEDIELIKISDITALAEYFVIASGTSSTQVKALADEVEYVMSKVGIEPHHIEGRSTSWILLDYSGIVVHVFNAQERGFYNLDKLWTDGEKVDINKYLEVSEG